MDGDGIVGLAGGLVSRSFDVMRRIKFGRRLHGENVVSHGSYTVNARLRRCPGLHTKELRQVNEKHSNILITKELTNTNLVSGLEPVSFAIPINPLASGRSIKLSSPSEENLETSCGREDELSIADG